ncbi:Hypothetical protein I595_2988 [Croceitalea dokdonensis DOKDO 023]|uniref:Uncharacterized protein n=1 Tax=Croceitalea dokdonensis DOKDO 023 TaxID=1300341 RepID=A0A0P7AG55_9FLAO|nr:Hypothetical protein I595_2988 [Croceitalea dokdonensis DOKDO 023]
MPRASVRYVVLQRTTWFFDTPMVDENFNFNIWLVPLD